MSQSSQIGNGKTLPTGSAIVYEHYKTTDNKSISLNRELTHATQKRPPAVSFAIYKLFTIFAKGIKTN